MASELEASQRKGISKGNLMIRPSEMRVVPALPMPRSNPDDEDYLKVLN